MTEDFRRIVKSRADAGQREDKDAALSRFDLDGSTLVLTAQGKVAVDMAALKRELAGTKAGDIATFAGVGTTGIVPDPRVETGRFLRDDGRWAEAGEIVIQGGVAGAAAGYLDLVYGLGVAYDASNKGLVLPFAVQPVWMAANVQGNSTCTFQIRDEGTGVTNATLSYAAQSGKRSVLFIAPAVAGTISALRNISLAVSSGTAATGSMVWAGFRRVDT